MVSFPSLSSIIIAVAALGLMLNDSTTTTTAFTPPLSYHVSPSTQATTTLSMGLFDSINKAFSNTEYGPPPEAIKATARHILVPTQQEAQVVMKMITSGESTFQECAQDFSTCPSAAQGGSLGSFGPGKMVPEFDKVIFSPDTKVGQVVGPVLTDFGFHIIMVEKRTGGGDKY